MLSPFQLGANALLFVGVNMYGVCARVLAQRSQRRAFLQARTCIEDRLRLEDENEKQVGAPWVPLCKSPAFHGFKRLGVLLPGLTRGFTAGHFGATL